MKRAMQRLFWPSGVCVVVALSAVGCASKASPVDCSVNVPASCPDPSLSYASRIGGILTTTCVPCHSADGVERTVPLTSYSEVSKRLTSVAGQLETCVMPPASAAPLSASDRQAVID